MVLFPLPLTTKPPKLNPWVNITSFVASYIAALVVYLVHSWQMTKEGRS